MLRDATPDSLPPDAPAWLKDRLVSVDALVREYDRAVHWEIDRLHRAFLDSGIPWVLLKGAAYLAAGLPPGNGRRVADIDILVPERDLARSEEILKRHGWDFPKIDPYDDRFYRQWMHESPPMVHTVRGSIVDVHHAILPKTSRLHPSSERLLERSVEVAPAFECSARHTWSCTRPHTCFTTARSRARFVTSSTSMRCCAGSASDPGFWPDLVTEARALELTRPAYYAIRNSHRLLDTPVPSHVLDEVARTLRWRRSAG